MNLKCPTLCHFRWYKDVFLTRVMSRQDCQQSFWKEKVISRLPVLFAEKVRTELKNRYQGQQINYQELTMVILFKLAQKKV